MSQKQSYAVGRIRTEIISPNLNNPLTNHSHWHILYPLVIVRLNTLISKYGASRELIHFKDVLETHLPYVTEFHGDEHLLKDINHTSHVFRGEIQKFTRYKNKTTSKLQKTRQIQQVANEFSFYYDFSLAQIHLRGTERSEFRKEMENSKIKVFVESAKCLRF